MRPSSKLSPLLTQWYSYFSLAICLERHWSIGKTNALFVATLPYPPGVRQCRKAAEAAAKVYGVKLTLEILKLEVTTVNIGGLVTFGRVSGS